MTKDKQIYSANKLIHEYLFSDFKQAIEFINKVAEIAERLNHHPNINLHDYKKVTIEIYTHSENKLTAKDYALEKEIEDIFKSFSV